MVCEMPVTQLCIQLTLEERQNERLLRLAASAGLLPQQGFSAPPTLLEARRDRRSRLIFSVAVAMAIARGRRVSLSGSIPTRVRWGGARATHSVTFLAFNFSERFRASLFLIRAWNLPKSSSPVPSPMTMFLKATLGQ